MASKRRAAFIKLGEFSHINAGILGGLNRVFPDVDFDVIDVRDHINFKAWSNVAATALEYAPELLLRRQTPGDCLEKSAWIFRKIRSHIAGLVSDANYDFTFQTQSRFDARCPGIPHFVYTDHTHLANLLYPDTRQRDLFPRRWIRREKVIYQRASTVFTMSNHVSQTLKESYGLSADKVEKVFAGANIVPKAGVQNRSYGSREILFVGVDWERKGGPQLEAAFIQLLKTVPDAKLVVVGCSPDLRHVPNTRVVGKVPCEEVSAYFLQADLFCLPTRAEPFGIVFLEAMMHGLPVVATEVGALPDIVGSDQRGTLCQMDDIDGLTDALREFVSSPEKCASYGAHGVKVASQRFTWDAVAEKMRARIEEQLGSTAKCHSA